MDYGKFIKEKRKEKSISLKKLSALTGIPDTTLCNWENGHVPPVDKYSLALNALEVSLSIGAKK